MQVVIKIAGTKHSIKTKISSSCSQHAFQLLATFSFSLAHQTARKSTEIAHPYGMCQLVMVMISQICPFPSFAQRQHAERGCSIIIMFKMLFRDCICPSESIKSGNSGLPLNQRILNVLLLTSCLHHCSHCFPHHCLYQYSYYNLNKYKMQLQYIYRVIYIFRSKSDHILGII